MASWDEATAIRRIDEGRYAVIFDGDYVVGGESVHGGYLVGTLLRAVLAASPHPVPVASGVHFLRFGRPGPAEVRLEPLKIGRTVARTRATVIQGGRPIVEALVATGTQDGHAEPAWTAEPPKLPPVEDCVPGNPLHLLSPGRRFLERMDMRFDPATAGWIDGQPSGIPEMRAYFRLREGFEPDAGVLALAIDALPPVTYGIGVFEPAPTVELTLYVRAMPSPGWLTLGARGRLVRAGWFDEEVEAWDSAGRLVAQGRQLART